ncbi:MAG TPA: MEDS domain-containing protein [Vicinamibacterales bacterium]|nr:MEDS domain-containing protein [Vicinamibacterales bacterium]
MRPTGIDIIGDVPWGTHFCQFYQNERDLTDVLVPYFKAGLEANEFCMWVTSEPLRADAARRAMAAAVGDLDDRVRRGQIEFLDYKDWYTVGGSFEADRVLRGWVEKLEAATARGFEGLRLTGNTFWLEQSTWNDFTQYEAAVNAVLPQHRMLAMCTYSLAKCGAAEIMDVMSNHAFALIRRADRWQVIESAERKQMEASLRESEARYRSLFNAMSEGFALHEIVCDESGQPCDYRFLDINPAFERLTGLVRAQVVGKLMSEVLPNEDPSWIRTFGRVALTGEPVHFENYAPALRRHYEILAYRPAPGQFAVVFLDVSERRRVEQQLAEANRLKDEFLATLSHELRTPLHAIIGWSDVLLKRQPDPETVRQALESISRNAQAQSQLVADVLDVSRIVAGKLRLNVSAVDLAPLLLNALDVVRPAAQAKGIVLQWTIADGPLTISGDPDRLQQILWNLLSNAVKFTPARGRVDVRVERVDSQLSVTVKDTGIGIEPEFLPFVFERFRQADSSTSRSQSGLGLGLAIVRHLVELHGGTVRVESEGKGRGSTFTLRLPIRAVVQPAEQVSGPAAGVSRPAGVARKPDELNGRLVLVVDDEADARDLVKAVLMRHGAEVRTAGSVAEALEALSERRPDLLLADIGMPGEDGYSLIRRVRAMADPGLARIPAVALTAYGRADDRTLALAAGFQQHVAKPVLPDELVAVVASVAATASPTAV